jgi:predicted peptidase
VLVACGGDSKGSGSGAGGGGGGTGGSDSTSSTGSHHQGGGGSDSTSSTGGAGPGGGGSGGWVPGPDACDPPLSAPTNDTQRAFEKGTTCAALGYHEYVPPDYSEHHRWPLILAFHGDGERGNGTSDLGLLLGQGLPFLINNGTWDPKKRFVVLSPQMDDRGGLPDRTGPSVEAFVKFAISNYDIDPKRIYMTGYSGGAEPIYNYLGMAGENALIAAALPISGWYSTQNTECTWKAIPFWYFHGAVDGTVPAADHSTKSYDNLVACDPAPPIAPRYTMYRDRAHDDWNLTYDLSGMDAATYPIVATPPGTTPYDVSIYDWFLQQSK